MPEIAVAMGPSTFGAFVSVLAVVQPIQHSRAVGQTASDLELMDYAPFNRSLVCTLEINIY